MMSNITKLWLEVAQQSHEVIKKGDKRHGRNVKTRLATRSTRRKRKTQHRKLIGITADNQAKEKRNA